MLVEQCRKPARHGVLLQRAKHASAMPSAAASRSSPSDSAVSTSPRRGALHGAAIASSAPTVGARVLGGAEAAILFSREDCVTACGTNEVAVWTV